MSLLFTFFAALLCFSQQIPYTIIPKPVSIEYQNQQLVLSHKVYLSHSNMSDFEFEFLQKGIESQTKISVQKSNKKKSNITFEPISNPNSKPTDYYEIHINEKKIHIFYTNSSSKLFAIQSLLQIISYTTEDSISIQCGTITDYPTFKWRGMHLDVVRHFFSVDFVKKYIDYLALYKFNTFHWHLTDDQGWRIEIKKYPKLTEIGSQRSGSMIGHYSDQTYDSIPYGGFYTQEQIKEVVAYAKNRQITIVPEIEMPGHALAALAAYPELACEVKPYEVAKSWGVFDDVFCPKEETFTFLENVLNEVLTLFDSEYIHIGGDECPKVRWKNCAHCQSIIQKENLKDEHELQSYFIKRIDDFLTKKGRKIIGWDEILEGGISPNATIMSWRGENGAIEAAKSNHYAVMTPGSHCYFDHYQGNPEIEPIAFGGYTTLEKVYQFQPIPKQVEKSQQQYILGAQANVWTEYISTPEHVEYMIFPRITALSEVVWGTSNPENYTEFIDRLQKHFILIDSKGISPSKAMYDVSISTEIKDGKLYAVLDSYDKSGINYMLNSERKTESEYYTKPIEITENTTIKAAYMKDGIVQTKFVNQLFEPSKTTAQNIRLADEPHPNYNFGGSKTLIDAVSGNPKRFGKNWLGFSGKNADAEITFSKEETLNSIEIGFLKSEGSWIHFPTKVEVFAYINNAFVRIKEVNSDEINQVNGNVKISFPELKTNSIKVIAHCKMKIEEGKAGAGQASWVFIDEIKAF